MRHIMGVQARWVAALVHSTVWIRLFTGAQAHLIAVWARNYYKQEGLLRCLSTQPVGRGRATSLARACRLLSQEAC
ncbi:hypothetical protein L484_016876 [Morus notabilis]|uniref:Uncharacterized protein n=1 Tax=Morus notabilis TaxID=981085 RepID=W9RTT8_9ROSA|nr:hypothetical protein L484_016876 [Morus notabilis]